MVVLNGQVLGGKAFLNLPGREGVAAICAEVSPDSWSEEGYECSFSISDCSRVVNLAFGQNRENDLYKVDTLISVLREFRKGLVAFHKHKAAVEAAKKVKEAANGAAPN